MDRYSLRHLPDAALLDNLHSLAKRGRAMTADLIAHIGEVDARRLYLPACTSMFAYCMSELHLSEPETAKRLCAARKARRFPVIFQAVADGRLHLTAILLLAKYLDETSVDELVALATHKSRAQIEKLIAERHPKAPVPDRVRALPVHAPERATTAAASEPPSRDHGETQPVLMPPPLPQPTPAAAPFQSERALENVRPRVVPLAAHSYEVRFTMTQPGRDLLQRAQELRPGSNLSSIFERALELLVTHLEKRKFAQSDRPRASRAIPYDPRVIPAEVKRAVNARDGGRCTFVGPNGRCDSRAVEFDHVLPVARGGKATIENLRLRCRPHNQYAADLEFGREFMNEKRGAADKLRRGSS